MNGVYRYLPAAVITVDSIADLLIRDTLGAVPLIVLGCLNLGYALAALIIARHQHLTEQTLRRHLIVARQETDRLYGQLLDLRQVRRTQRRADRNERQ